MGALRILELPLQSSVDVKVHRPHPIVVSDYHSLSVLTIASDSANESALSLMPFNLQRPAMLVINSAATGSTSERN